MRKLGHGWKSPDANRQRDHAKANARAKRLRREMTPSEKELWRMLREEPGRHFRKQVPVDDFVFDFGELRGRLLIELDGAAHEDPEVAEWDRKKEAHARGAGFKVLRLTNAEVWGRPDWVLEQVRLSLDAPHPPIPSPQGRGGEDAS